MIDLAGRSALITGAARGIGRASALAFARAGARVSINYRVERPSAESLAREITASGGEAFELAADVSDREEADMLVDETVDRFGGLDILLCNAGIWRGCAIDEISDLEWAEMLATNLTGTFNVIRAAVPHMKTRGGRIITVSSTAGQRGEPAHAHYAATKGAIIALTKSLAVELAPHGILTNCIAPGWVATDMTDEALAGDAGLEIARQIPLGRVGRPEEIAGVALFLASGLASFVNGAVVSVNGGAVLAG